MSRKHQEVVIQDEPITVDMADGEPLYEADAYGSPQLDVGADVTVMKQVGIGGPVPIVAPKHNTIQLQPIVVPLAVVPYMTQDSNVLRTDSRQGGYESAEEESYGEDTSFDTVERRKAVRKKRKTSFPRIFSFVSFIVTALFILPFFLSYKMTNIGVMEIAGFDVIGIIKIWIAGGFDIEADVFNLIYVIVMGLAGIQVVLTALGIIIGKYPKPISPILSFLNMGCFIGILVYDIVQGGFIADENIGLLVMLSVSAFNFLLTVIFSVLLNRREDREEQRIRRGSEI
jgi:hypothetical protein